MSWHSDSVEALGMVEVEGVAGIIAGADGALKAASVELLGWESIGGFTTVFFSGTVADVAASLKAAEGAARQAVDHVVCASINQPDNVFPRQIGTPAGPPRSGGIDLALGLVETRGYGVQVDANDRITKAADVEVANVLSVHNRVVCTVLEGEIGAVREALDTARQTLESYDHLLGLTLITQPEPAVLGLFGGPAPARVSGDGDE